MPARRHFRSFSVINLLFFLLVTTAVLSAEIPFDPSRGLVEIEVVVNDSVKGIFGIDTGADRLYIDREFARRNNLSFARFGPQRDVAGIDGNSPASFLSIESLAFGDQVLRDLRATAIDMEVVVKDQRAGAPDGLIGHEILRQFFVSVDYPGKTIELSIEPPDFLSGKRFVTVPYQTYRHLIIVDAVFNDDVTAPMLLDYCASVTVVSPALAEQIELVLEPGEVGTIGSVSINYDVTSDSVYAIITDLTSFKRSTPRAEFEGILGATFLRHHRVTIDYQQNQAYFRNPK
jgi:hypothetical protein